MEKKIEFIRFLYKQIELKKARKDPDAKDAEQKLHELIAEEMVTAKRLKNIEDNLSKINFHHGVVNKKIYARAMKLYGNIPDTLEELRNHLVKNYCKWELCRNKGGTDDLIMACKYAVLQLEALFNHFQAAIIDFVKSSQENMNQYNHWTDRGGRQRTNIESNSRGEEYMKFKAIAYAATGYFYSNGTKLYVDLKKVSNLYDIRNFESHPIIGTDAAQYLTKLSEIELDPESYFSEVNKFIKPLVLAVSGDS